MTSGSLPLRSIIAADRNANPRDPKSQALLVAFRVAQAIIESRSPHFLQIAAVASYRIFSEWFLGIELRPKTKVGPGLAIFHGFGLVVNDHAVIGSNVELRNGVTIGHRFKHGPCPVIEDDVEVGAGALILGGVRIGRGAKIGAGAVVLHDVPAGRIAVGNPARVLGQGSAKEPRE